MSWGLLTAEPVCRHPYHDPILPANLFLNPVTPPPSPPPPPITYYSVSLTSIFHLFSIAEPSVASRAAMACTLIYIYLCKVCEGPRLLALPPQTVVGRCGQSRL